jgi:putative ABC transport system permease protein
MTWENMKRRKLRTSLTTLGVIIGITTIVALASLGEGFRITIKQRMEQGFELDVLIVIPGSFAAGLRQPFTPDDVNRIKGVENVSLVTPIITIPGAELFNKTGHKLNALTVAGVNFTEISRMLPQRFIFINGTYSSPEENNTVILGYKVNYPNETVSYVNVNENVTMNIEIEVLPGLKINKTSTFRVGGILQRGSTSSITNFDYWAFIPIDTAVQLMEGKTAYHVILVKVADPEYSEEIADEIESLFPPYSISVFVPLVLIRQVDNILNVIQLFLAAIASISLLVAGIGIMNITTVSVMERTREIGILKAIGAKDKTIMIMFLAETVLIGIFGGAIGIPSGYGIAYLFSHLISSFSPTPRNHIIGGPEQRPPPAATPMFSVPWAVGAFIFGILICILFGLYPARKAAKLDPVEALRYE